MWCDNLSVVLFRLILFNMLDLYFVREKVLQGSFVSSMFHLLIKLQFCSQKPFQAPGLMTCAAMSESALTHSDFEGGVSEDTSDS